MVAAGLGCTLLPAMAVPYLTARHSRLEVRPLHAKKAYRHIGLLWRASFPRSEDLEVFGRFIQQQLPDTVELIGAIGPTANPARVRPGSRPAP